MIAKNVVSGIVNEWLEDKEYFLVDIEVTPDNKIVVKSTMRKVYGLMIV